MRAKTHEECVLMFRNVQKTATDRKDTESARQYNIELQRCIKEVAMNARQLDAMVQKRSKQLELNDGLKVQYQTSNAVFNQQIASLSKPPLSSDVQVAFPYARPSESIVYTGGSTNNVPVAASNPSENAASSENDPQESGMDGQNVPLQKQSNQRDLHAGYQRTQAEQIRQYHVCLLFFCGNEYCHDFTDLHYARCPDMLAI